MFQNKIQVHVYLFTKTLSLTDRMRCSQQGFLWSLRKMIHYCCCDCSFHTHSSDAHTLRKIKLKRIWLAIHSFLGPGPRSWENCCAVEMRDFRFSRYCKWYFIQQIVGPWFSQILECKHEKCATPGAGTGELAWGGCTRPPASWCQLSCSPGAWSADVLVRLVLMC